MPHSKHFEEGTYLLNTLLTEMADQIPDRMHLVWSDQTDASQHPYRAVSAYNASLSIEWGRSSRRSEGDAPARLVTDWSRKFADHEITTEYLDVCLNGASIYRLTIASVDGGRCWIPFPVPSDDGEFEVTAWASKVVALANDLVHSSSTFDFIRRANIEIVEIPPLVGR